jgi:nucleoside-diphosphate-sugar epimerase
MIMRVLVLGSGGYLGAAVVRAIATSPDVDLAAHYQFPPGDDALPDADTTWLARDLMQTTEDDLGSMFAALAPDAVVNCIGLTSGPPPQLRAVNVDLTKMILAGLPPHTHFVHLGSAAEYGEQPCGRPIREDARPFPNGPYATSKFESTELVLAAADAGHIRATVLRVFNPVGRGAASSSLPGRAAAAIEAALRSGDDVVCLGSLSTWRDYVDTRDVARAAVLAVGRPPSGGVVLNVGRGEAVLSRRLVQRIARVAGFHGEIRESIDEGSERSVAVPWQCAAIGAIRDRLGWVPRHGVEEMVRDLWCGVDPLSSRHR